MMRIIFFSLLLFFSVILRAQEKEIVVAPKDSASSVKPLAIDTTKIKKYSPKTAALRSAILPGLGQIYNKKYWKLPIVYAFLGTTAGIFAYNLKNYRDTRFAFRVKYNMRANGTDSALYASIKENLKPLSEASLRFYRDQYRRDIDYSALFFLVFWGLNVVDAAVDAHLKAFDVSPDLGLYLKPGHSEMAGTNGISLVLAFK